MGDPQLTNYYCDLTKTATAQEVFLNKPNSEASTTPTSSASPGSATSQATTSTSATRGGIPTPFPGSTSVPSRTSSFSAHTQSSLTRSASTHGMGTILTTITMDGTTTTHTILLPILSSDESAATPSSSGVSSSSMGTSMRVSSTTTTAATITATTSTAATSKAGAGEVVVRRMEVLGLVAGVAVGFGI